MSLRCLSSLCFLHVIVYIKTSLDSSYPVLAQTWHSYCCVLHSSHEVLDTHYRAVPLQSSLTQWPLPLVSLLRQCMVPPGLAPVVSGISCSPTLQPLPLLSSHGFHWVLPGSRSWGGKQVPTTTLGLGFGSLSTYSSQMYSGEVTV